jgi:hypothetical protein
MTGLLRLSAHFCVSTFPLALALAVCTRTAQALCSDLCSISRLQLLLTDRLMVGMNREFFVILHWSHSQPSFRGRDFSVLHSLSIPQMSADLCLVYVCWGGGTEGILGWRSSRPALMAGRLCLCISAGSWAYGVPCPSPEVSFPFTFSPMAMAICLGQGTGGKDKRRVFSSSFPIA